MSSISAENGTLRATTPRIAKRGTLFVLTAPIIIAGILGVVHAATDADALVLGERIADFFHVAIIGVACGLFLALPWFCLSFALEFREENGDSRHVGTEKGGHH